MNSALIRRYRICKNGFHSQQKWASVLNYACSTFSRNSWWKEDFSKKLLGYGPNNRLDFEHDAAVTAVQKTSVKSVKMKFGNYVAKGEIPNESDWTEAKNTIEDKKFVQASLSRCALLTLKQIIKLDVDQFLVQERLVLRKTGCRFFLLW